MNSRFSKHDLSIQPNRFLFQFINVQVVQYLRLPFWATNIFQRQGIVARVLQSVLPGHISKIRTYQFYYSRVNSVLLLPEFVFVLSLLLRALQTNVICSIYIPTVCFFGSPQFCYLYPEINATALKHCHL